MQTVFQNQQYNQLMLFDETGKKIQNNQFLVVASSGFGKTLAQEVIAEKMFEQGYIVIHMTDVKDVFEPGFCMFPPQRKIHLKKLMEVGKKPGTVPAKIYHPFTFNIPKNKLAQIEFFTFNIKELKSDEFSYILETPSDSDSVVLLTNLCKDLNNNEGIYDFMHLLQKSVLPSELNKELRNITKPNKQNFWLKSLYMGSRKNISEISTHFKPFITNFMLQPANFQMNIDFKKMLADNKHYHCLSTKWIKDKKLKYFVILNFFNRLFDNLDYAKHPVLLIFEEVRVLIPSRTNEFYINKMAMSLREKISQIRNKGRGCSTLGTSQVYYEIHPAYRDSATELLLGKLVPSDISKLTQSLGLGKDIKNQLDTMKRNCYYRKGDSDELSYTFHFPKHCHKEEGYEFMNFYRRHYPDLVRDYKDLLKYMQAVLKDMDKKFKEMALKELKETENAIKENSRAKEEAREARIQAKEATKSERKNEPKNPTYFNKEKAINVGLACLKDKASGMSLVQIGQKYGFSHAKAGYLIRIAKAYQKKQAEAKKGQDLEETKDGNTGSSSSIEV